MAKKKKTKMSAAERARRRAANHTSGGASTTLRLPSGVEFFSPKKGKYLVDILSYPVGKGNPWCEEGEMYFERTYFVHRNVGIENQSYICPRLTAELKCPICEYRAKLLKEGADKDLISSLKPQERQLWNVIDATDRKQVMLWDISTFCFGAQLDGVINECDEDENFANFSDLEDGYTLKLGVDQESGQGFTFIKVNRIGFKPRKKNYDESILEKLYNLDDLLILLDYDKLNSIFLQMPSGKKTEDDDDDDDDDDDVDSKKSKKSKGKKKTAPKPEPEEEDDDFDPEDDLDDDDDDDEPAPPKKGKKAKKVEDEDLDDDDLDDDDDDDEPAPPKKGKKKTKKVEEEEDDDDDDTATRGEDDLDDDDDDLDDDDDDDDDPIF